MTNEEYYKNIYRIKDEIQTLDDTYWSNEMPTNEETETYEKTRKDMCEKLEEAYKA